MARPFTIVEENETPEPGTSVATSKSDRSVAVEALLLSMQVLGRKTLIALSNLFSLITALTVFWAALGILHDPTTPQLVGLGMYALFILAINVIVRRA
jgi:uncharacterized membrane protein